MGLFCALELPTSLETLLRASGKVKRGLLNKAFSSFLLAYILTQIFRGLETEIITKRSGKGIGDYFLF